MNIFSLVRVVDARSLKAIILTSRQFHDLGIEELLCALVWKRPAKAGANLEFWDQNMNRRYIPTALVITLPFTHLGMRFVFCWLCPDDYF
jgi:hypothetical protein